MKRVSNAHILNEASAIAPIERMPSEVEDVERWVLAHLLAYRSAWSHATHMRVSDAWWSDVAGEDGQAVFNTHRAIYQWARSYYLKSGQPPSERMLQSLYDAHPAHKEALSSTLESIAQEWVDERESYEAIDKLRRLVGEAEFENALASVADTIERSVDHLGERLPDIVAQAKSAIGRVDDMLSDDPPQPPLTVNGAVGAFREMYEEQSRAGAWLTEIDAIDRHTHGGFRPGTLVVLAAGSGGGKSLVMLDWAARWRRQGANILFVSCEVARNLVLWRYLSHVADVEYGRIRSNQLDEQEIELIERALKDEKGGRLVIDDASNTLAQIENVLRAHDNHPDGPIDILVLDYLANLTLENAHPSTKQHEIEAANALRLMQMAKRRNILAVTATQFHRGAITEQRQDEKKHKEFRAGQDSLGGSQQVIKQASWAIALMGNPGTMVMQSVKAREGGAGFKDIRLRVDAQHYRLIPLEPMADDTSEDELEMESADDTATPEQGHMDVLEWE